MTRTTKSKKQRIKHEEYHWAQSWQKTENPHQPPPFTLSSIYMSDFMRATSDRQYFLKCSTKQADLFQSQTLSDSYCFVCTTNTLLENYLSLTVFLSLLRKRSNAFTWQNTWFYILPTMDTSHGVFLFFQQAWLPHKQDAFREHSICHVVSCNLYPLTCYDLTWEPRVINLSLAFIPAVPVPFTQRYKSSGWSYDSTSEVLTAWVPVIRPRNTIKSSRSSNL